MSKKCTRNRLALASQKNFMSKTKRRVRLGKNTSSCPRIRVGSNLATLHFPSGTESKESQRQMLVKGHAVVTCKFFFLRLYCGGVSTASSQRRRSQLKLKRLLRGYQKTYVRTYEIWQGMYFAMSYFHAE